MRRVENAEENKLTGVVCNRCGRELKVENGYLKEGCFAADFIFGYFSTKDGTRHRFDLCEECYDNWTKSFTVPVEVENENELL